MMVWRNFWRGFSGCKLWLIVIVNIRDRDMYFSLSFLFAFLVIEGMINKEDAGIAGFDW